MWFLWVRAHLWYPDSAAQLNAAEATRGAKRLVLLAPRRATGSARLYRLELKSLRSPGRNVSRPAWGSGCRGTKPDS